MKEVLLVMFWNKWHGRDNRRPCKWVQDLKSKGNWKTFSFFYAFFRPDGSRLEDDKNTGIMCVHLSRDKLIYSWRNLRDILDTLKKTTYFFGRLWVKNDILRVLPRKSNLVCSSILNLLPSLSWGELKTLPERETFRSVGQKRHIACFAQEIKSGVQQYFESPSFFELRWAENSSRKRNFSVCGSKTTYCVFCPRIQI